MFGANFPVSSGRCTRGIFMQLISIEEKLSLQLRYDYLVLLDTEGLRAPEFSINSYTRDNELATFAVGLGDMTIINMSGESHSEVQDILQIIVFAFIRMKEISRKPRCVFVHQNVPDLQANENLLTARSNLIKTLDQMTICAAHQENKTALFTKFFEVIEFYPEKEVFYFPGLFEGEPPFNQISPGYTRMALKLHHYILNCYSENPEMYFLSVKEWSRKLKLLWKSILKENFVFSYKNALEVITRIELDHHISAWHSKYIFAIANWKSESVNELFNASPDELDEIFERLTTHLREELISPNIEIQSEQDLMENFFVKHEHVAILLQWKGNTALNIRLRRERILNALETEYYIIFNLQKTKVKMDITFNNYRKEIVTKVHRLFLDLNQKGLSLKDNSCLENKFQSIWNEWKSQIEVESIPIRSINIDLQRSLIDSQLIKSMCVLSRKSYLVKDPSNYTNMGQQEFKCLSQIDPSKHSDSHYYSFNNFDKKSAFRVFISSIFSQKPKDKGVNQFLNALTFLTDECERFIQEYSSDLITKQCSYDPNSFFIVIDNCYEILNNYNIKQSNNIQQSIELTKDLLFDFIFHQCCKSIPIFENIQKKFISRTNLDSKFNFLQTQLKENFIQLCEGIESEYVCATELARITMNGMKDYLSGTVSNMFRSQFENDPRHASTYQSRNSLILHILKDLARAKNFNNYISYIANPFNYIITYVQRQLEEYAGRQEIIASILQQLLTKVHSLVNFYVISCNESNRYSRTLPTYFYIHFHSRIKTKIRNVSLQDLDILTLHSISNYEQFCELYRDEMNRIVKEINWVEWLMNILREEKIMYKSITDNLLECRALCPFCKEPCQLSVGQHEHYCGTFHRPKGVNGWRHRHTNTISVKECTTSIQDQDAFYYHDIRYEYVNYRTVNEEFNTWSILGEDAVDSKYWQWVLYLFQDRFVEHYDIVKNDLVSRWSSLTEQEVLNDLEAHYRSFSFKND